MSHHYQEGGSGVCRACNVSPGFCDRCRAIRAEAAAEEREACAKEIETYRRRDSFGSYNTHYNDGLDMAAYVVRARGKP